MKHSLANHTVPPLIVALVIACVWYALDSRPNPDAISPTVTASTTTAGADKASNSEASVMPAITPTVQKVGTELHFSVVNVPIKDVQKVEFYIENRFVGTAYSQPYSVAVSQNTLTAGNHQVVAKIYTTTATAQSQPAAFTAQPSVAVDPSVDSDDPSTSSSGGGAQTPTSGNAPAATTPAPKPLDPPYNTLGTIGSDGTSATLSWTGPTDATQYQVLRDGVWIATTAGTGFTDTGLNPGQTYDYQIIALDSTGHTSDLSDMIAVTMPSPPPSGDNGPVNVLPPSQDGGSQSPSSGI